MSFGLCAFDFVDIIKVTNELRKDRADTMRMFIDIPRELKAFTVFHQYVDVEMTSFKMPTCRAEKLESIALSTVDIFRRLQLFAKYGKTDNEAKSVKHVGDEGNAELCHYYDLYFGVLAECYSLMYHTFAYTRVLTRDLDVVHE